MESSHGESDDADSLLIGLAAKNVPTPVMLIIATRVKAANGRTLTPPESGN